MPNPPYPTQCLSPAYCSCPTCTFHRLAISTRNDNWGPIHPVDRYLSGDLNPIGSYRRFETGE